MSLLISILLLACDVQSPAEGDEQSLDGYIYLYDSSPNSQNLDTTKIVYGYLHNFQNEGIVKIEDRALKYYITANLETGFFHYSPEDSILTLLFESESRMVDNGILKENVNALRNLNVFLFSQINTNFCTIDSGFCVDWENRKMLTIGIGRILQNTGAGRAIAIRAAKMDALRGAFEGCKDIWVNDSSKISQLMAKDDVVVRNIKSFIRSLPVNYTATETIITDTSIFISYENDIMGIKGLSTHVMNAGQGEL